MIKIVNKIYIIFKKEFTFLNFIYTLRLDSFVINKITLRGFPSKNPTCFSQQLETFYYTMPVRVITPTCNSTTHFIVEKKYN